MKKPFVIEWDTKIKMVCMAEDENEIDSILEADFRDKIENWTPDYARIMRDYYEIPVSSYDECEWHNFRVRLATDADMEE